MSDYRKDIRMISDAASMLILRNDGAADECQLDVPPWFWEQVLSENERREELIRGWLPVAQDPDLALDVACVTYHHMGQNRDSVDVKLSVPALLALKDAIDDADR